MIVQIQTDAPKENRHIEVRHVILAGKKVIRHDT